MEAIKENKAEVYRLTERFPIAHLKVDQRTGNVCCFYGGNLPERKIKDFVYALFVPVLRKLEQPPEKNCICKLKFFEALKAKGVQ